MSKSYLLKRKDVNNTRGALNDLCKNKCEALRGKRDDDYWILFGGQISVNLDTYYKPNKSLISIYSENEKEIRRIKNALKKRKVEIGNLVEERI